MAETVTTDGLTVIRDEAVELMVHHIQLAAMFFEATPDDDCAQIKEEIQRKLKGTPAYDAALAFTRYLHMAYEAMKKNDYSA